MNDCLSMADIEGLYRRYSHTVMYRCGQFLRDEEATLDAMHQTFVRAIRYRSSYRGSGPVAWLLSIAVRVSLDELGKRAKESKERVQLDEDAHTAAAALDDFGECSMQRRLDQQRLIASLLPRCNKQVQQLVVMRYFDGLEIAQIAESTSLSQRTVARRLSRFIEQARKWAKDQPR